VIKVDSNLIPEPIRCAIENTEALKERRDFQYSTTVLIKSPREVQLERRFADELAKEPFSPIDNWYSFVGDAFHSYVERGLRDDPRYIVEQRLLRTDLNRTVGSRFDCYDKETKTLSDHKTTTTYIFGKEMKEEWIKQLMINAFFLEEEGYPVDWVSINAVYVDWRDSKLALAKDGGYPPSPSTEFRCRVWPLEERRQLYLDLLQAHIEQESTPTENLPECHKDYCWERPAKFAVYKEGADKAIRVLDTLKDAHKYITWKGIANAKIQHRPPSRQKCEKYCRAAKFCDQYQNWLRKLNTESQGKPSEASE
jgi:hypothetical protein